MAGRSGVLLLTARQTSAVQYVDVLLPLPLEGLYTYALPSAGAEHVAVGTSVVVTVGTKTKYTAVVAKVHSDSPEFEVKEINAVASAQPVILPAQLQLWQWVADYYLAPLGEVYKAAVPAPLRGDTSARPDHETFVTLAAGHDSPAQMAADREALRHAQRQREVYDIFLSLLATGREREGVARLALINAAHTSRSLVDALCSRGILTTYEQEVGRVAHLVPAVPAEKSLAPLTTAQNKAYTEIKALFTEKETVLLHGVTSSGKTEIFIHLIAETLRSGKQVLYLLPEIALTVQIMQRLRKVFGSALAIYHSRYSVAERAEIWRRQLSDSPYPLVLGARSAVFLPFQNLGLVIVDEEQDASFKQEEPTPRYHGRAVAQMLAHYAHAHVLLATATPAVETYYNATTGKYGLVTLTTRYGDMALPTVEIVDTRDLRRRKVMKGLLAPPLTAAIQQALEAKKQAIIFHNRRGYTPVVECRDCGGIPRCDQCDVPLALHRSDNRLLCHYCGRKYLIPAVCPDCGGRDLTSNGVGTEQVEEALLRQFPQARVARLDIDSTRSNNAYTTILDAVAARQVDILVGTQMVSKGLDFDNIAVVGILDADILLNMPDFRAYERAFQMMAQVSGRAGRKEQQGQVFLQTKSADVPLLQQIANNDYEAFYRDTLAARHTYHYPPFCNIITITLRHKKEEIVAAAATYLAETLRKTLGNRLLGPDTPTVAKVRNEHWRVLMVKVEREIPLSAVRPLLRQAQQQMQHHSPYAAVTIIFNVDPH